MAAAAQSTVSLPKYGGSSTDNWTDFESLFRSIVEVTGIADAQRVGFLKLHLKDSALQFFHTLDQNTRADLELTITALKNHFCNPNLKEIHHMNLENMKFNHKTESAEEFLVKLQNLALKAYPTPVDVPVAPVDGDVPNDQDRFDRETRENQNRRNFSQMERERHIIRLFNKAMPNFIRLKLLEEPEDATIQELCTKARQKLILRELCPVDGWSRDRLNEMSSENSEKFLTVLTKMSENQNSLENRIDALTQKLNSPQQISSNAYKKTNNKLGEGISEAERTKIEETEAFQIIKDFKIETINIKDRIIIKTTKIAADMVIISIEEAIEREITLEAIIEATSRITITIIPITAIFSSKDIKVTKQQ